MLLGFAFASPDSQLLARKGPCVRFSGITSILSHGRILGGGHVTLTGTVIWVVIGPVDFKCHLIFIFYVIFCYMYFVYFSFSLRQPEIIWTTFLTCAIIRINILKWTWSAKVSAPHHHRSTLNNINQSSINIDKYRSTLINID